MIGAVYVVTDAHASSGVLDQVRAAAAGGAWAVQLRDKEMATPEFCDLARAALAVLSPFGAKLFINDRVDVAVAVGADGLHVGQSDGDPALIRARIGPDMMLGLSIGTLAECRAMGRAGITYIGAGPIRATATKPDHAPPIGLEGLQQIVRAAPCPVIAIGGIGAGDPPALKATGAAGMAVVSAVTRAADPQAATRRLVTEWSVA
jgi:thiamine-phosphate pyrophosphorylase